MRGQSDALTWDGGALVEQPITRERTAADTSPRDPAGFPLAMASVGERLRVVGLRAGRHGSHRLVEIGLAIGKEITLVQTGGDGPLVIALSDLRLGIDQAMARKVLVTPVRKETS